MSCRSCGASPKFNACVWGFLNFSTLPKLNMDAENGKFKSGHPLGL